MGLVIHTRDGKKLYFANLNEAVTEEITKRVVTKLLDNPLFTEEARQTREVITMYPEAVTGSGEPLFDDDVFYAKEVESEKSLGGEELTIQCLTYKSERRILNTLIDKILEKNPDKFQDKEEVFEVFAKGMITGNILPVGRLVERTFGKGTLRKIGELDQDLRAQEEFVNSL